MCTTHDHIGGCSLYEDAGPISSGAVEMPSVAKGGSSAGGDE